MTNKLGWRRRKKWQKIWNELQRDFGHPDLSVDDLFHIIQWWEDRQMKKLLKEGSLDIPHIGRILIKEKAGHSGYTTKTPPGTDRRTVYVPPRRSVQYLTIKSSKGMRQKMSENKNNQQEGMVKLGVHTQPHPSEGQDKVAQAARQELCPECAHPVQVVMGQRACPFCGTGPFER